MHASALALMLLHLLPAHAENAEKTEAPMKTCAKPEWPGVAIQMGMQGTTTLQFLIEPDGHVGDAKMLKSSGYPELDTAAIKGISKCIFKPGMTDGKPVAAWMQMQYVWKLEGATVDDVRRAADSGYAESQFTLAHVYRSGRLVAKNDTKAVKYFRMAAEQNHAEAQYALAIMLGLGMGASKDQAEAAKWIQKSAEGEYPPAQLKLAVMYASGAGVDKNAEEAARWMRRAADKNNAEAENLLGAMYEDGIGLAADPQQAFNWYLKAATAGNGDGQYNTAQCYENGIGVKPDLAAAALWYGKAVAQNHEPSRIALAAMEQRQRR